MREGRKLDCFGDAALKRKSHRGGEKSSMSDRCYVVEF